MTNRSSSPSLSKSPASTPMLASAVAGAVHRRAGQQRRVLERAVVLVDPQLIRLAVVGDVDVDPAVAVEVGGRDAERRAVRAADERLAVTSSNVPFRRL